MPTSQKLIIIQESLSRSTKSDTEYQKQQNDKESTKFSIKNWLSPKWLEGQTLFFDASSLTGWRIGNDSRDPLAISSQHDVPVMCCKKLITQESR